MSDHIKPEQLPAEIKKILSVYNVEVRDVVNEAVIKNAKDGARKLRAKSPRRKKGGGAYARSWTTQTTKDDLNQKTVTIYNKNHYMLTQLLEKGHVTRFGGFSDAIPHIAPVEREVITDYTNDVIKGIKNL